MDSSAPYGLDFFGLLLFTFDWQFGSCASSLAEVLLVSVVLGAGWEAGQGSQ